MKRNGTGRRRALPLVIGVLLLVGGLGAAYYVDHNLPYWHFRTVDEGAFYRTSQLDGEQLADAFERYGIKTIVNLRDVDERTAPHPHPGWYEIEQRVAREHGVLLLDVPLEAGQPPSPEQVQLMLSVMDDPAQLPVLVHCYHGSIRSAAAEGLYRREYMGEDGHRAMRRVESWGRDLEADYPDIAAFIKGYVPRRERMATRPGAP